MKNQNVITVVMTAALLIALILLSGHPFDISIFFGSAYLLRQQAGGVVFRGYQRLAAILVFWVMGIVSYPFVCPVWVLYPFLLLINTTIFFFAPATNAVTMEEKLWKRKGVLTASEMSLLEESLELRRQKKNRSIFLAGLLSLFTVIMHGRPISSLLLVTLLAEMISVLKVIWESLLEEPHEM